jgi:hypothetical protein
MLTWFDAILFVGTSAIFGGVLQVFYKFSSFFEQDEHTRVGDNTPRTKLMIIVSGVTDCITGGLFGLGGGAAVTLAAFWLNKFDMENSDKNKLYLIALGVVAGFVGYRILPRVAQGLEERMYMTEKETRLALDEAMKAIKDAQMAKQGANHAMQRAIAAQRLTSAVSLIEHDDYTKAESGLRRLIADDPLNSVLTFTLSKRK